MTRSINTPSTYTHTHTHTLLHTKKLHFYQQERKRESEWARREYLQPKFVKQDRCLERERAREGDSERERERREEWFHVMSWLNFEWSRSLSLFLFSLSFLSPCILYYFFLTFFLYLILHSIVNWTCFVNDN